MNIAPSNAIDAECAVGQEANASKASNEKIVSAKPTSKTSTDMHDASTAKFTVGDYVGVREEEKLLHYWFAQVVEISFDEMTVHIFGTDAKSLPKVTLAPLYTVRDKGGISCFTFSKPKAEGDHRWLWHIPATHIPELIVASRIKIHDSGKLSKASQKVLANLPDCLSYMQVSHAKGMA